MLCVIVAKEVILLLINITPSKAKAKAYGTTVKVEIVSLLRSKVNFLDNRFILEFDFKTGEYR